MKPVVIGLYSSVMQSGKSSLANYLVEDHGFVVVKFAGILKGMCRHFLSMLGFDAETIERMIEGDLKELPVPGFDFTPRHLMITLGSDWGRQAVEDGLWIKLAMAQIKIATDAGKNVVVDDMRFPNEFDELHKIGAILMHVIRPQAPETVSASEGLLNDFEFDAYIVNSGTLEELRRETNTVMGQLGVTVAGSEIG
jgi:hypothetical protein